MKSNLLNAIVILCGLLTVIGLTVFITLTLVNSKDKEVVSEQIKQEDAAIIEQIKQAADLIETYYEKASEIYSNRTGQYKSPQKILPSVLGELTLVRQGISQIIDGLYYETRGQNAYVLCADFNSSNLPEKSPVESSNTPGQWFHGVGYYCFEIKVGEGAGSGNTKAYVGVKSKKPATSNEAQNSPASSIAPTVKEPVTSGGSQNYDSKNNQNRNSNF